MDFEERLHRAIQRGQHRGELAARQAAAAALTEEELRRLHTQHRLAISEHIEDCVRRLPHHLPGFQYETIYGERGWGGACKRDDVRVGGRKRETYYSRLELTVRPYSPLQILELTAKGTIFNREIFDRRHYEPLVNADPAKFQELVDLWVLEYAELYAARG